MASVLASRSAAKGRRLNIGSTNASDAYTEIRPRLPCPGPAAAPPRPPLSARATALWGLLVPALLQQTKYLALHLIAQGLDAVGHALQVGKVDELTRRVRLGRRLLVRVLLRFHAHNRCRRRPCVSPDRPVVGRRLTVPLRNPRAAGEVGGNAGPPASRG
jgi:hypothetical protein